MSTTWSQFPLPRDPTERRRIGSELGGWSLKALMSKVCPRVEVMRRAAKTWQQCAEALDSQGEAGPDGYAFTAESCEQMMSEWTGVVAFDAKQ